MASAKCLHLPPLAHISLFGAWPDKGVRGVAKPGYVFLTFLSFLSYLFRSFVSLFVSCFFSSSSSSSSSSLSSLLRLVCACLSTSGRFVCFVLPF